MHHIYKFFDQDGRLLYVGSTANFLTRIRVHAQSTPWYPLVRSGSFVVVLDKKEALQAERDTIITGKPMFNIHKTRPIKPYRRSREFEKFCAKRAKVAEKMREMRTRGKTMQEIAAHFGISRQRVHQLINKTKFGRANRQGDTHEPARTDD